MIRIRICRNLNDKRELEKEEIYFIAKRAFPSIFFFRYTSAAYHLRKNHPRITKNTNLYFFCYCQKHNFFCSHISNDRTNRRQKHQLSWWKWPFHLYEWIPFVSLLSKAPYSIPIFFWLWIFIFIFMMKDSSTIFHVLSSHIFNQSKIISHFF